MSLSGVLGLTFDNPNLRKIYMSPIFHKKIKKNVVVYHNSFYSTTIEATSSYHIMIRKTFSNAKRKLSRYILNRDTVVE